MNGWTSLQQYPNLFNIIIIKKRVMIFASGQLNQSVYGNVCTHIKCNKSTVCAFSLINTPAAVQVTTLLKKTKKKEK